MSIGLTVRSFFQELFGSSLVKQLKEDLMFARNETERVRQDNAAVIAELRAEKQQLFAKLAAYEARVGVKAPNPIPMKPNFDGFMNMPMPETSWQKLVRENEAENARLNAEEEAAKKAAGQNG